MVSCQMFINTSEFSVEMIKEYGSGKSENFMLMIPKDKSYMGPDLRMLTDLEWNKQNEKNEIYFENGFFI
jgi:hypothetical protein